MRIGITIVNYHWYFCDRSRWRFHNLKCARYCQAGNGIKL